MAGSSGVSSSRYWAFISYSHQDAAFGRRLHRRLEGYTLPRRLVGQITAQGTLPRRLAPIFRDREEFSAAGDLNAEVLSALAASRSLIVVCSTSSAGSRWVSREVECFRALHPDRPILAALFAGEPEQGFPEALRRTAGGSLVEPLAADFRKTGDGERLAVLKLVAGIAGIGLDTLVQRDAQRRVQRVTAITAAAFTAMIAMGVLTAFTLRARAEADHQRAEAEGLVEFMLTDLRAKLKEVGRLDAMTTVNNRALKYYANNGLASLPPDSLERRSRILHAMGEDDESKGDYTAAIGKFEEAWRTTAELLNQAPRDPNRIFNHSQSEFWIGQAAFAQRRYPEAKKRFQAYKELADQLIGLDPNNPTYLQEVGYAEGNLCAVALKEPRDTGAALNFCLAALSHMQKVVQKKGSSPTLREDLANRHGWLADAYRANRNPLKALQQRRIQGGILDELVRSEPNNKWLKFRWVAAQRILAWLEFEAGDKQAALFRIRKAAATSGELAAFDRSNRTWASQRAVIEADIKQIENTGGTQH